MNVAKVFAACGRYLRDTLVRVNDPELGTLSGWPHFYNEDEYGRRRPTAIGTAYGYKLSMIIGERCHELDQAALTDTLWKLRGEDGGWAARTGIGIGRPEVTALVLGALATGGCRRGGFAEAARAFEDDLALGLDLAGMGYTYVVCSVIRGMVRLNPGSPLLPELRKALLTGAIKDGGLTCWSDRMSAHRRDPQPSMPHTAMAIVALARVGQMIGDDPNTRTARDEATRWLASRRDLGNLTDQIRREVVGEKSRMDSLTVHHFTAGWLARALLLTTPEEFPAADELLGDAIRTIWRNYRDGYWVWEMGYRPLWMAYQSACVLRDYALRTSVPL